MCDRALPLTTAPELLPAGPDRLLVGGHLVRPLHSVHVQWTRDVRGLAAPALEQTHVQVELLPEQLPVTSELAHQCSRQQGARCDQFIDAWRVRESTEPPPSVRKLLVPISEDNIGAR